MFYQRMLKISWTEHMKNEEVLRKAGAERSLIKTIRKRQLKFLGHIMRKEGLGNQCLTGCIKGTRSRGRQCLTYLGSLSKWTIEQVPEREKEKMKELQLLRATNERKWWRAMIAFVLYIHTEEERMYSLEKQLLLKFLLNSGLYLTHL